jgi:hypothetical protein
MPITKFWRKSGCEIKRWFKKAAEWFSTSPLMYYAACDSMTACGLSPHRAAICERFVAAMKWVLRRPQISIEQCSFWIADGQIVKICTTICWRNLIFWTWQWLTSSGLLPKAVRHMGAKYISAADITSLLYISISSSIFYVHSHANKCLAL